MSRKVLIDTFNSGLSEPTGIGTYTRSLADAHHRLGDEVFLLTEAALSARAAPKRHEKTNGRLSSVDPVMIFDRFGAERPRPQPAIEAPWYIKNRLYSVRGLARKLSTSWDLHGPAPVQMVDQLDAVDLRPVRGRLGYFDHIMNSSDLFRHALFRFRRSRQPTLINLPADVDVAHFTYCLPIRVRNAKRNIYTIHDLVPLRYPYLTMDDKWAYYDMVRWCCDTADTIVTVSEHSRAEIIDLLGVPADKVVNTYQPVEGDRTNIPSLDKIKSSLHDLFGLTYSEYFLLAGAIEPRKNVARTIEAHLTASTQFPLVICGPRNPLSQAELAQLNNPAPQTRDDVRNRKVIVLNYLPRHLLLLLMAGARAVLLPSITEGFGLSGCEAMCFGTPVIASNGGALPEVYGEAAASYVDPYNTAELRDAIDKIASLGSGELDVLKARCIERVKRFSVESYCGRLHDLHNELLSTS